MGLDASIYQNVNTPPPTPLQNPMDVAQKALTLSQLAMQNQQLQQQTATTQAVRSIYAKNTDQNGNLNQPQFLSDLGKVSPQAAMQYKDQFSKSDKEAAEAQSAKMDATGKIIDQTLPHMEYLNSVPSDQRPQVYHNLMQDLSQKGVPMQNVPPEFSQPWLDQTIGTLTKTKAYIDQQKSQAEIAKTYSDIGQAPAKLNSELYGSRSPNATLTDQYTADAKPIRSSQLAMKQMLDNYSHPSPQGDASLILNAFKIKFPTAPDVNSLKELSESQAAPDQFKQWANKALSGGLDTATRDNLMRDGVSTFRANVDTLRDYQDKYKERAKAQNVSDTSFLSEPGVDKTYAQAMKLQDKIGPYVPPSERGGIMAGLNKLAASITGVGGNKPANADSKTSDQYRKVGSPVSADEVAQYATKHNMKLSDAQKYLRSQGYAIGR